MTEPSTHKKQPKGGQSREDRLKAALKANLARRKAQARVRRSDNEQDTPSQDGTQE